MLVATVVTAAVAVLAFFAARCCFRPSLPPPKPPKQPSPPPTPTPHLKPQPQPAPAPRPIPPTDSLPSDEDLLRRLGFDAAAGDVPKVSRVETENGSVLRLLIPLADVAAQAGGVDPAPAALEDDKAAVDSPPQPGRNLTHEVDDLEVGKARLEAAQRCLCDGEFGRAVSLCDEAAAHLGVKRTKLRSVVFRLRAGAQLRAGDWGQAINDANRASFSDVSVEDLFLCHVYRAQAWEALGCIETAHEEYQAAHKVLPSGDCGPRLAPVTALRRRLHDGRKRLARSAQRQAGAVRWEPGEACCPGMEGGYWHSATLVKDKVFMFGGFGLEAAVPDLFVLNTSTRRWCGLNNLPTSPPSPYYFHSANLVGTTLFVFGGWGSANAASQAAVVTLDTQSLRWAPLSGVTGTPPPVDLVSHTGTVVGTRIYVVGGMIGGAAAVGVQAGSLNRDVYVFDTATRVWSRVETVGDPPPGRYGHTTLLYGSKLVVFGGRDTPTTSTVEALHDVCLLDVVDHRWEYPTVTGADPPRQAAYHGACVVGHHLLVFGGGALRQQHLRVSALDLDTMTWTEPRVLGTPPLRRFGQSCTLVGSTVYVIGGMQVFRSKLSIDRSVYAVDVSAYVQRVGDSEGGGLPGGGGDDDAGDDEPVLSFEELLRMEKAAGDLRHRAPRLKK